MCFWPKGGRLAPRWWPLHDRLALMAGSISDPALALLRETDRERYFCTLFLPPAQRNAAAALYAFNAEMSAIVDKASEPMPGEIRLQWWSEVLLGTRDSGEHPLAVALAAVLLEHKLPAAPLLGLIEAQRLLLYHDPMPDRTSLESWCGESFSVLLQLIAMAGDGGDARAIADASGHGGVAIRLVEIISRLGRDRRNGRCLISLDMLAAAGLDHGQWLAEPADTRHLAAIGAMIALARKHHALALAAAASLPAGQRVPFLPLAVAPLWLERAERAGLALLQHPLRTSLLLRQWAVTKAAMLGLG